MLRGLPNFLTALRLLAVPLMVVLFVADDGHEGPLRWASVGTLVFAAGTDFLDGYLARRWGVVTSFGKLADPVADKAIVLGALGMLALAGELPWWVVAVVALREVVVTLGRFAVAADTVIPASRGGKVKTVLQMTAIGLLMLPAMPSWVDVSGWWLMLAAVAITLITGVDYGARIARAATHQRRGERMRHPQASRDADVEEASARETGTSETNEFA